MRGGKLKKKGVRTLLIVLGAVVLLVLFIILNRSRDEGGVSCDTRRVGYGAIISKVSGSGKLRAESQVNLQAQVMGVVKRVRIQEGERVRKGDTLLELDRTSYAAQLALARAQFEQTQAKHIRNETLFARGLIAPEQYEASLAAYEVTRAQLEQAQDQFDKTVICAPISGTVTQLNIKEGETVLVGTMNNPGTVMLVIADLSRMQAVVEVDETDVVSVKIGQAATVTVDALLDTTFSGRVTRVGYMPVQKLVTAEQSATNFQVEITLDSTAPALRPGMNLQVEITTARLDSVLVVPIQGVGRRKVKNRETETVFCVKNGRAVLVPVRTGVASDTEIEIVEGLSPGDEVIIGPYKVLSKLTDGARVKPQLVKPDSSG